MTMNTGFSLQTIAARYQNALITKAAFITALGAGCCALLAFRLKALQLSSALRVGLPAICAAGMLAALFVWLRKRWMDRKGLAAFLDNSLGLEQRLVTAEEFAKVAISPLYPSLVEDLRKHMTSKQVIFPKPFDHTAGLLMAVLLFLLLWPKLNPVLPPPMRQPDFPQPPKQQPPPPDQKKQDQKQEDRQQQDGGGQQQQQQAGAGQQQQQPGGAGQSTDNNQQDKSGAASQPPSSVDDQQQKSGSGAEPSSAEQQKIDSEAASAQQAQSQPGGAQPAGSDKQDSTDKQRSDGQPQQGSPQSQAGNRQQKGAKSNTQSNQDSSSSQGQPKESPQAQQGSGSQGKGQSFGEGAALKADIQQLLKEMSGELKNLQAQLESAQEQERPEAGKGTDPDLYGDRAKLEELPNTTPLPIELKTDTRATKSGRPSGDIGKPSDEVANAAPKTEAQAVSLSDQPLEEAGSTRQPVPAEYRPIFDELRRSTNQ